MTDTAAANADDREWRYLCDRRLDLRLRALMNRIYQQERQRRLELREAAVKVLSLVAGSAALARVADAQVVTAAAALIFAGTAASLVLGWGNRARDAARRASDWATLERDIEAAGERGFTEAQLAHWAARCNEIEATEPAANATLLERCYRRAAAALGATPAPGGPPTWRPVLLLP